MQDTNGNVREEAHPVPFMWAYQAVGDGEWSAFTKQLKRADGSICPGRALYTTPPAPEAEKLRVALEWYGEQARLARLIHSEGDAGRHALADDGGKRARDALAALQQENA